MRRKKTTLHSAMVENPFEYVFFRHAQRHLCRLDKEYLRAGLLTAARTFKAPTLQAVLFASRRYLDRYGCMPAWAHPFFRALMVTLDDSHLVDYIDAAFPVRKR